MGLAATGAIEAGIKASQQVVQANHPGEQARAFNLLMLANIGRRDLDRAQAMAHEGYALQQSGGEGVRARCDALPVGHLRERRLAARDGAATARSK